MKKNDKDTSEAISLLLRVTVSTGEKKEHIYLLPEKQSEAAKTTTALAKNTATQLVKGMGILHLMNPSITYNIKHIVCIEAIFRGPAGWEEIIKKSIKPPLGFRPEKPSE